MFAALCVLLAAAGHLLASGQPLPWWAPALALPATGGATWFLTGRERGVPVVLSATVVAQLALHQAFSLTTAASGAHATAHAGHPDPASAGPGMALAHLAAALASGLWLAHGERAVFRITRAAGAWLLAPLRLLRRAPFAARRRCPAGIPRARRWRPRAALRIVTTRGPPAGSAVL
ncbi:hypothetical protein H7827_01535 [Streptomyces sp. JH002]|uniref:hypothetical protein n=1 Tax=Streptomyces TaxID=1883 RepID=UPI0036CC1ADC